MSFPCINSKKKMTFSKQICENNSYIFIGYAVVILPNMLSLNFISNVSIKCEEKVELNEACSVSDKNFYV